MGHWGHVNRDQDPPELAGAIIFLLTASIVGLNFFTDLLLSVLDPRIRKSIIR